MTPLEYARFILKNEKYKGWVIKVGKKYADAYCWRDKKLITINERLKDNISLLIHEIAHIDTEMGNDQHNGLWGDRYTDLVNKYLVIPEHEERVWV
jgi:hypothetical protein